ncbi:MAG: hypothetical protein WBA13_07980 [Microcoleaceae cyanobacterium]
MSRLVDDITQQAHKGSIAAIIQVLNQRTCEIGVRTRAIFVDGVLQLLCEATQAETLEQSHIVPEVQNILEYISPRHVHRVRINSRLVQEQQLLWFDDISQDPEHQLLWYTDITLSQPNVFQQIIDEIQDYWNQAHFPIKPRTIDTFQLQKQRQFQKGLVGGVSLGVGAMLLAVGLYYWFTSESGFPSLQLPATQTPTTETDNNNSSPQPISSQSDKETFNQAVRLAQEAVLAGEQAQTATQWRTIAEQWQQASILMSQVSPDYERYTIAQNRAALYQRNAEVAEEEAEKLEQRGY